MQTHKTSHPSLTNQQENADPHAVFESFLEIFDLVSAKNFLKHWIKAVYQQQSWSYGPPGDLFYFYERLLELMEAAWLVHQQDSAGRTAILKDDPQDISVFDPTLFCKPLEASLAFKYFPRELSLKEFMHPYRAFKKIFRFQQPGEWKQTLHDMLEVALSNHPMQESGFELNLVAIKQHLTKLLEAAQLITVREYLNLTGGIAAETVKSSKTSSN